MIVRSFDIECLRLCIYFSVKHIPQGFWITAYAVVPTSARALAVATSCIPAVSTAGSISGNRFSHFASFNQWVL
jgi:hypothetical protein